MPAAPGDLDPPCESAALSLLETWTSSLGFPANGWEPAAGGFQRSDIPGVFSVCEAGGGRTARATAKAGPPGIARQWMMWCPRPLPPHLKTLAILSSRIVGGWEAQPVWLEGLRSAFCRGTLDGVGFWSGDDTVLAEPLRHWCRWTRAPLIRARKFPNRPRTKNAWRNWFATQVADHKTSAVDDKQLGLDRPEQFHEWSFFFELSPSTEVSTLDSAMACAADYVKVLAARSGGAIERAIENRLATTKPPETIWLWRQSPLLAPELRTRWLADGALDWYLHSGETTLPPESSTRLAVPVPARPKQPSPRETLAAKSREAFAIWNPEDDREYLFHATRGAQFRVKQAAKRCDTPLDWSQILWGQPQIARGPLLSLLRIAVSGYLRGSPFLIPDRVSMVCFSAHPLSKIGELKKFRGHLGRWDFQPFGVAVRRDWLIQQGGRAVTYGSADEQSQASKSERPWFQVATSGRGAETLDWSVEQEWRVLGDVDLKKGSGRDVCFFVPDSESAVLLSEFSRWPIKVLPADPRLTQDNIA